MQSTLLSNCSDFTISNSNRTQPNPCGFTGGHGTKTGRKWSWLMSVESSTAVPPSSVGSSDRPTHHHPVVQPVRPKLHPASEVPFKSMKTEALEGTIHLGTGRRAREAASFEKKALQKRFVVFSLYFLLSSEHQEILRPN